jgi:hypothetical protein
VNKDNAILSLGYSLYRAYILTRRLAAVQTMGHYIPELWFALYLYGTDRKDPYPFGSHRQMVLLLTGYLAGITTDTVLSIDYKCIFHETPPSKQDIFYITILSG